jgi:hypothetical protein
MMKFLMKLEYLASRFGSNILPQGDFAVASYETDNPEKSFKVLATSNKPWAVKFREHLNKAHGLDIAQSSMQLNEAAVNWEE